MKFSPQEVRGWLRDEEFDWIFSFWVEVQETAPQKVGEGCMASEGVQVPGCEGDWSKRRRCNPEGAGSRLGTDAWPLSNERATRFFG